MDWAPFAHLRAANYPPSSNEVREIKALLTVPLNQLSELDAEISRLQSIINDLKAKRSELSHEIVAGQVLIAPFRRVPQEILQEIFIHCLPTQHNAIMSPNEAPLMLGRVCRRWRKVSMASRNLWSSIHIVVPDEPGEFCREQTNAFLEAVRAWLGRSGRAPLSISLFSPSSSIQLAGERVLSTLIMFSNRWKHVSILGTLDPFSLLASISKEQVPILESFFIYYDEESFNFRQLLRPPPSDIYHAPLLRTIGSSFTTAIPREGNLTQLTSLSIGSNGYGNTYLEPPYALEILRQCPNIVKCRMWLTGRLHGSSPSRHGKYLLPLLENLIIGGLRDALTYFFDSLDLPSLVNLECSEEFHESGRWPFLDCLSRSNANALQGAKITSLSPTRDNIATFLNSAPSLARFCYEARLGAKYDLFNDDILSLFMPTTQGLSPCPRLKGLEIYYSTISDIALLDFIRARTVNASAFSVDHLESVLIQFGRTEELDILSELPSAVLAETQVELDYEEDLPAPKLKTVPRGGIDALAKLQYDIHPSLMPANTRPSWCLFPSPDYTTEKEFD